jgi:hypothetical protein
MELVDPTELLFISQDGDYVCRVFNDSASFTKVK